MYNLFLIAQLTRSTGPSFPNRYQIVQTAVWANGRSTFSLRECYKCVGSHFHWIFENYLQTKPIQHNTFHVQKVSHSVCWCINFTWMRHCWWNAGIVVPVLIIVYPSLHHPVISQVRCQVRSRERLFALPSHQTRWRSNRFDHLQSQQRQSQYPTTTTTRHRS